MATDNKTPQEPRDKKLTLYRFFILILPVIVILGAFGGNIVMGILNGDPEQEEETIKSTPVVVATAKRENVNLSITTQGEATPRTNINLSPNIAGRIDYVSPHFIEGGAFRRGDTLVSIENQEYKNRVIIARASVAQAESRYANEKAESESARLELDDLDIQASSALALREPQMAEAAAMLASAKASLSDAQLQLARTNITAPFDGRVVQKMADIGEYVAPGTTLGRIFSSEVMEIRLPLTDNDLAQLGLTVGFIETESQQGPEVLLSSSIAGSIGNWKGRIVRTDASYDAQTRVLFAYAAVNDPYGTGSDNGVPLAAGLFVTANIQGRNLDNAITVPRAAIRGENKVFIAKSDNSLEIRNVQIAKSDKNRAIIISGLTAGERVITSPVRNATAGQPISVSGDSKPEDKKDDTTSNEEKIAHGKKS